MRDFIEVFENPLKFFRQKRSFSRAFLHFLAAIIVFVVLNELTIQAGLVTAERELQGAEAVAVNILSAVGGYFAITAISFLPLAAMGRKNYRDFFTVTAYSLTPLVFFWIPHLLPQAIVVIWSVMLMMVGTSHKMKISYRKSLVPVFAFVALVVLFSFIFGNYILVPLNRI